MGWAENYKISFRYIPRLPSLGNNCFLLELAHLQANLKFFHLSQWFHWPNGRDVSPWFRFGLMQFFIGYLLVSAGVFSKAIFCQHDHPLLVFNHSEFFYFWPNSVTYLRNWTFIKISEEIFCYVSFKILSSFSGITLIGYQGQLTGQNSVLRQVWVLYIK